MSQTMKGIRVLEVAQWWFVPASTAILADWGADVIKVEHPVTGDPMRGLATSGLLPDTGGVNFMVEQSNRGKKSVGIDIATDGGREVLYRLARECDVFVTSFLPDARRRLEIDGAQIVQHAQAIMVTVMIVVFDRLPGEFDQGQQAVGRNIPVFVITANGQVNRHKAVAGLHPRPCE